MLILFCIVLYYLIDRDKLYKIVINNIVYYLILQSNIETDYGVETRVHIYDKNKHVLLLTHTTEQYYSHSKTLIRKYNPVVDTYLYSFRSVADLNEGYKLVELSDSQKILYDIFSILCFSLCAIEESGFVISDEAVLHFLTNDVNKPEVEIDLTLHRLLTNKINNDYKKVSIYRRLRNVKYCFESHGHLTQYLAVMRLFKKLLSSLESITVDNWIEEAKTLITLSIEEKKDKICHNIFFIAHLLVGYFKSLFLEKTCNSIIQTKPEDTSFESLIVSREMDSENLVEINTKLMSGDVSSINELIDEVYIDLIKWFNNYVHQYGSHTLKSFFETEFKSITENNIFSLEKFFEIIRRYDFLTLYQTKSLQL